MLETRLRRLILVSVVFATSFLLPGRWAWGQG